MLLFLCDMRRRPAICCRERGWGHETNPDKPSVAGSAVVGRLCAGVRDADLRAAGGADGAGNSEPGYGKTAERNWQRRRAAAVLLAVRPAGREGETACILCSGGDLYRYAAAGKITFVGIGSGRVGLAVSAACGSGCRRRSVGKPEKSAQEITLLCKLPCIFLVGK